jgi:transposase
MSFVTSAKRSTPFASASTAGFNASRVPSSRARNTLCSAHPQNLTGSARKNLRLLLVANKRLNTAYVLKESFGQLWDYNSEAWARKFFDNWRAQLKWQRLKPYEEFADMIERN